MKPNVLVVAIWWVLGSIGVVFAQPPNVVVIVSDDAGYRDFGAFGGRQIPTPHVDQLAADGIRCRQGYVCASVCHPSRVGLLTGRYPHRFGQEFNGPGEPAEGYGPEDMGLDVGERTLGDAFQASGYQTFEVGKWHMGRLPQFHPLRRGFDHCFSIASGNRSYFPISRNPKPAKRIVRDRQPVPEEDIVYVTDTLADAAVDYINAASEKPFLLYVAFTAVHTPMQAKASDIDAFSGIQNRRRRVYAAMMKAMDDGIGRIINTLKERKLYENTLVIFINDNGGPETNASDNGDLRGVKGTHFEGGNRVPFVISWPQRWQPGVYDHPVSALDVLPTTVAAIGSDYRSAKPLDGVNLVPYLEGTDTGRPHPTLYWRRFPGAAIRDGDWKLLRVDQLPTMLFNLADDPGESINLAGVHPDKVRALTAKLEAWEAEMPISKWTEGERWEKNQRKKHAEAMAGIRSPTSRP